MEAGLPQAPAPKCQTRPERLSTGCRRGSITHTGGVPWAGDMSRRRHLGVRASAIVSLAIADGVAVEDIDHHHGWDEGTAAELPRAALDDYAKPARASAPCGWPPG